MAGVGNERAGVGTEEEDLFDLIALGHIEDDVFVGAASERGPHFPGKFIPSRDLTKWARVFHLLGDGTADRTAQHRLQVSVDALGRGVEKFVHAGVDDGLQCVP